MNGKFDRFRFCIFFFLFFPLVKNSFSFEPLLDINSVSKSSLIDYLSRNKKEREIVEWKKKLEIFFIIYKLYLKSWVKIEKWNKNTFSKDKIDVTLNKG